MKTGPQSLDEFLTEQTHPLLRATIEPLDADPKSVKVTPWAPGKGCLCHLSIVLPRHAIDSVNPTGDVHACCGKHLRVVEVTFKKDQLPSVDDLLAQLVTSTRAAPSGHAQGARQRAHPHPPFTSPQMARAYGDAARAYLGKRRNRLRKPRFFDQTECDLFELECCVGCSSGEMTPGEACQCSCQCQADYAACTGDDFDLYQCMSDCPYP
jgi:hypothetical protein